jgi:pimeloyl-ACP methyl ester carboxylesterase
MILMSRQSVFAAKAAVMATTEKIIVPGVGRLAYREAGVGSPLILIHGSPDDARSWSRLMPRLAEHYRVIAPDLPGYGSSDPLPEKTIERTAAMGAAICHLIDSCGEVVRICGHSYGGNVAVHAAIARRTFVGSLVLLEPVFFRALYLAGELQAFELAVRFFGEYADRVDRGESGAVSQMIDYWFGAGRFEQMHASVRNVLMAGAARNGLDVRATFAERLTVDQLAGFGNPVLVAYGSASPPAAPAIVAALVGLLPRARPHVVPGAGHGMLDSHPDALADLILASDELAA